MFSGLKVSLNAFESRHLEKTREWNNNSEIIKLVDRAFPVSDIEHQEWFANLHKQKDCLYFAIEKTEDNHHIGNVWLWQIDWRHRKAEIRIIIGEKDSLGIGLGTEALSLISRYAFERLNLHKVYAYVLATNPRALNSFKKSGFIIEGELKKDRWVGEDYSDVFLLGKLNA